MLRQEEKAKRMKEDLWQAKVIESWRMEGMESKHEQTRKDPFKDDSSIIFLIAAVLRSFTCGGNQCCYIEILRNSEMRLQVGF